MVTAERKPVLVVIAAAVCLAWTARSGLAEEDAGRGTMTECFFHQVEDGSVWLSQPLVALGMIGVGANTPMYRLNDDLARQLAPLVNRFSGVESREFYWWHHVPHGRGPSDPTILVTVIIQHHKVAGEGDEDEKATSKPMRRRGSIRQIDAAEILQVEIVPRSWLDAWDTLDKVLKETVDISKNAPGTDKRARLTDVIQRGGEALGIMLKAVPTDKQIQDVHAVVPKARVVKTFQRRVEREWGGRLRQFASSLAIQPPKPLPPDTERCSSMDRIKLLLESDTPAAFIAIVKQLCSSEALDEMLTFSMLRGIVKGGSYMSQPIYVWQVERMPLSDFEALCEEIRKNQETYKQHHCCPVV